jgi:hypothetical protein
MDGGPSPIRDGDLVLCRWALVTDPKAVEGRACLLTGGTPDGSDLDPGGLSVIKVPVRRDGHWYLRSWNERYPDRPVEAGVALRVAATVVGVVEERRAPRLWSLYDRDAIARLFGEENGPPWRVGHKDVEHPEHPQTVLLVNLRKPPGTSLEHRYADRFVAPDELQWESQATVTPDHAKGRRIVRHEAEGRTIHLFVRYHSKTAKETSEPYTYCGPISYVSHEGSAPTRFRFRLETPLPRDLWAAWSTT